MKNKLPMRVFFVEMLNALREPYKGVILQPQTGEDLSALLPSVLGKAFKGNLCNQ